ncbi:hypothetical protein PIB30_102747 [Stylosanthes scabra]|uniref:Disease resistance protein Roq1-like winged-helix domain-containing protein n=1 Tax=Stylosanthes scabra TaxID=79078 RepID=A0ABU6VYR8_9FABA|nr:hypothetical protein [Stylosanthes scabra]
MNAFKQNCTVKAEQVELSKRVLNYCKGLPLALKILGSFLKGKTQQEWESELAKLERMPDQKIQRILQVSFNELDRNDGNIFLDLACFFDASTEEEQLKFILDCCGYTTTIGLTNLRNKALISISNGCVSMHDLIREMGREIVREESPKNPEKRSRLWDARDIYEVLKNNKGSEVIESITLNMAEIESISLQPGTFERMRALKLFRCHSPESKNKLLAPQGITSISKELRYFRWDEYPLKSLSPSLISVEKIVEIIMPKSRLKRLWEGEQNLVNLRKVDIHGSSSLMELPNLSKASNLREVSISGCVRVRRVPPSAVSSQKLKYLNVSQCRSLESIEELPPSVVCVIAIDCSSLHTVSISALDSVAEEQTIQQQQFDDITFNFSDCQKLGQHAKKSITEHAYGRLKRPLAAAPTCNTTTTWKQDKGTYEYLSGWNIKHKHPKLSVSLVGTPERLGYITPEKRTITIDVSPGDTLLGFIFWVLVSTPWCASEEVYATRGVTYDYLVKVSDGPRFSYDGFHRSSGRVDDAISYVWYDGQCCADMMKVMDENSNTNNNNNNTIQLVVSFNFSSKRVLVPDDEEFHDEASDWGVHPVYASDVRNDHNSQASNKPLHFSKKLPVKSYECYF